MSGEESAHRVTISDVYKQNQSNLKEINEIKSMVRVLVDRDERDYERLKDMNKDVERLKKWMYIGALPLMVIASSFMAMLGIDHLPRLF